MCGIAGLVRLNQESSAIKRMLNSMKRRGPDEEGIFQDREVCLLHQRLTVIDPENGKQPMTLRWGAETYTIVYNGELYNTNDIRSELIKQGHHFDGYSDTEVLLHAYTQWSSGCLKRLNGIYAFAVWEHRSGKLFLARDRMGVKPLFYALHQDGFIFASELKTILSHGVISAQITKEGIGEIMLLGPGRTPGSGVFRNVFELRPGCFGYFTDRKFVWQYYWKLKDSEHTENFEDTAAHIRYLVVDAIRRQMVSDVPVGTFLSGGLDSSIISSVCAREMAEKRENLLTFSVGYKNNEKYFVPGKYQPNADDNYIGIMAEYLAAKHKNVSLDAETLFRSLDDAVIARDLPGMADVDSSLLAFCKYIREDVKVALSGECADEIFGGYPWYRDPEIRSAAGFPWSQNTRMRALLLHDGLFDHKEAVDFVNDKYSESICQCDILPGTTTEERRIKELVHLNMNWFMQTLLDRKDRMSMYNSLEVRVPFCDHRIAEYMYGVPWKFKEYQGQEKGLLRYAMKGYLPDEILNRRKSPYPKTYDPMYLKLVSECLMTVIADKTEPIHEILNPVALQAFLNSDNPWPWYGQLMKTPQTIAYMLQTNTWLKKYRVDILV